MGRPGGIAMIEGCLSHESLERIAVSEAPVDEQAHVQSCPTCREALADIRENLRLLARITDSHSGAGASTATPSIDSLELDGYQLHEEIHRGAQGVVFRATQRATNREVAIKVLLGGVYSTSRQRYRFEREIELVAGLDHPAIVTVFESGTTSGGLPYLAMQLIDGVPLDTWISRARIEPVALRCCLETFIGICDAVSDAHLHGVLHRDLKPANIMIDDAGRPHVLDFGLARSLSPVVDHSLGTMTTDGSFVGTIAYAAPEQVAGDVMQVDARADVYALGVMLYELLSGHRPHALDGSLQSALNTIAETPAPPLKRAGQPWRLSTELEVITATALAIDPARRYQSAGALSDDLRRHLEGYPIAAHGDSAWYLLRKALHRFRIPVAAALLLVSIVVTFAVVTWNLYGDVRDEAEKVREINVFLEDTLGSVQSATGGEPTLREFLDESVAWIELVLDDRPEIAAAIHGIVGNAYRNIGALDEAEIQLMRSLAIRQAIHGDEHPDIATSINQLAMVARSRGQLVEARRLFAEGLSMRKATLGDHISVAYNQSNLAQVMLELGEIDAARELLRDSLQLRVRLLGREHSDVAMAIFRTAELERQAGDLDAAIALHTDALAMRERLVDPAHPDLARSCVAIAETLMTAGRHPEAVPYADRSLELRQAYLPADHALIERSMRLAERARRHED